MSKIVCSVCGSSDVQAKVWVRLNENCETTTDFIDEMIREPADCWCCNCEENQKLIITDDDAPEKETSEDLRCEECGSTKVQIQAWVDPNQNNKFIDDCEDYKSSWCDGCESHVRAVPHGEFMEDVINHWWNETSFEDMEIITGLKESDFDPTDGSQAFVDACEAIWCAMPETERIEIWRKTRHLEVYKNE